MFEKTEWIIGDIGHLLCTTCDNMVNAVYTRYFMIWPVPVVFFSINIFAKESSRSDWGSNPQPTATPPSTKYQCSNDINRVNVGQWSVNIGEYKV
jgi:hypothetical protein